MSGQLKRLLVLVAAVVIQTCLGGVYAWSAFVPALRAEQGYAAGQTQLIFGCTIAVCTLSMVFAGRLLTRIGARRVGLLGGVLFGAGYLLAGHSNGHFALLLGGYSLLGGAGIGCGYVAALTSGIQWFPKHRGLITGVAVAGFGGGAVLLSMLTAFLLQAEWSVWAVFRVVGWAYGTIVGLAALLLFAPPAPPFGKVPTTYAAGLIRDPIFRALWVGIFCGTFAGLLVIGNLKPIGLEGGLSLPAAVLAISFFSVGNAAGRILWGWIADCLGYPAIPLSLLLLAAAVLALFPVRAWGPGFCLVSLLVGFNFGACFVVYVAQVAARYGSHEVARVYPLVFLGYGLAGITGPFLGGHIRDLTDGYAWALVLSIAVLLAGAAWTWRAWEPRKEV